MRGRNMQKKDGKTAEKVFSVLTFFLTFPISFIQNTKIIYIVIALLCIVGIWACHKFFKHGLILGIVLSIMAIGIICFGRSSITELVDTEKNVYREALEFMEEEEYELAIETFQSLSDEYLNRDEVQQNYEEAVSNYKSETFSSVDKLVEEKKYEEALIKLENATKLLGNDAEVLNKIEETEQAQVEQTAAVYIANKDYKTAIQYLEEKIDQGIQNEKIVQMLNTAKNEYKTETINQANQYITDGDYDAAEELLSEAIDILGEQPEFTELLNMIEAKRPVELTSIEARTFGTWLDLDVQFNYQDIFGNTYEGKALSGDKATLMDPFTFGNQYFINGEYKILRATVTILDDSKTGSIRFYNDDTQIDEYTFDIAVDKPYEIKVDVEDVNLLGIRIEGIVLANIRLYRE